MALIDDYKKLGFDKWLEKEGSLLSGFQDIQFFKTGSISKDGTEEVESISSGLVTLTTDKLGAQEIKERLSQFNQLGGGDVTHPINVVFGHIQSANFITGASGAGWRMDSDGNLEATSGTFRGAIAATSGTIAAFTIASTTISATNLTLTSGDANTANITVGTGANAGGLNSANVSGDIVIWAGDTHANRATADFRVTAAGALTATSGDIGGWTLSSTKLIGSALELDSAGNIRTAAAGSNRVEISSNGLRFLDSADAQVAIFYPFTTGNTIIQIEDEIDKRFFHLNQQHTTTTETVMNVGNAGLGLTAQIQSLGAATNDSGTLSLTHTGRGVTLAVAGSGNSNAAMIRITGSGSAQSLDINHGGTGTALDITSTANTRMFEINKDGVGAGTVVDIGNAGTGITFLMNQTRTTNSSICFQLDNSGTGRAVSILESNTSSSNEALYSENNGTGYTATFAGVNNGSRTKAVILISQGTVTSTNFRNIIREDNTATQIWVSDGTTPNGNLTGQAGDICLNGDSGNIYRSTGSTNWTAM